MYIYFVTYYTYYNNESKIFTKTYNTYFLELMMMVKKYDDDGDGDDDDDNDADGSDGGEQMVLRNVNINSSDGAYFVINCFD